MSRRTRKKVDSSEVCLGLEMPMGIRPGRQMPGSGDHACSLIWWLSNPEIPVMDHEIADPTLSSQLCGSPIDLSEMSKDQGQMSVAHPKERRKIHSSVPGAGKCWLCCPFEDLGNGIPTCCCRGKELKMVRTAGAEVQTRTWPACPWWVLRGSPPVCLTSDRGPGMGIEDRRCGSVSSPLFVCCCASCPGTQQKRRGVLVEGSKPRQDGDGSWMSKKKFKIEDLIQGGHIK